jgi:hypothetical protein
MVVFTVDCCSFLPRRAASHTAGRERNFGAQLIDRRSPSTECVNDSGFIQVLDLLALGRYLRETHTILRLNAAEPMHRR